jgi:hypothetical protein
MSNAMNAPSMKDKILETVQKLPADATVEDAMERLLFLAKVERGLREADGEDTISHSEVKQRFARCLKSVGRRKRRTTSIEITCGWPV